MNKSLIALIAITLVLSTQANFLNHNHHNKNQAKQEAEEAPAEAECCGPDDAEEIDACEVELLTHYQQIDVNRQLTVFQEDSVTQLRVKVTLDTEVADAAGSFWSLPCQDQFQSSLSYFTPDNAVVALADQPIFTVVNQETKDYEFTLRIVDVPEVAFKQVDEGKTEVIKFLLVIKNLRGQTLRKHIFRSYVHVQDDFAVADLVGATKEAPESKIFESDENCEFEGNEDGECAVLINFQTVLTLYKDKAFTIELTPEDSLYVGTTIYGKLTFQDVSQTSFLGIEHVYFNPSCCNNEELVDQLDIIDSAAYSEISHAPGVTKFKWVTFTTYSSAQITVDGYLSKSWEGWEAEHAAEGAHQAASQAPPNAWNEYGIFQNIGMEELIAAGFEVVFKEYHSHPTSDAEINAIRDSVSDHADICLAGSSVADPDNLILAAIDKAVIALAYTDSTTQAVCSEHGVCWYYKSNYSMGFSDVSNVSLSSCDTTGGDLRTCWHMGGSGGYRIGNKTGLNSSNDYWKFILIRQ